MSSALPPPRYSLAISELAAAYRERRLTPLALIDTLLERIAALRAPGLWITLASAESLRAQAQRLEQRDPASLPLYGIPFAIKDNIDLAGVPTTAACPGFAYTPTQSAYVVQRLLDAGALAVGKTNLDQFATGLVGTRSPYGACPNSFDPSYISGGSSSGSAVAVALGLASFALGTDTAGSGRIPAAFNNLIGLKPTCGLLSPRGMVPACRTLDTISIFALSAEDAARVLRVAAGFDEAEPYSRAPPAAAGTATWARGPSPAPFRFGVPRAEQLRYFGNEDYPRLFARAVARLESLGGAAVSIDFSPFLETAELLYAGPWIAERYAAVEATLRAGVALLPVTRSIIEAGAGSSAVQAFRAQYRLAQLRRTSMHVWREIDVLVTPTAGTHYRIEEVESDPITLNTNLGYYTNFMNLLDMAAVAVPTGFTAGGLPFGVTLSAPAWSDEALLAMAARLQRLEGATQGALPCALPPEPDFDWKAAAPEINAGINPGFDGDIDGGIDPGIDVAVCGAHLDGLPLNGQLRERGAVLVARTMSAPCYRFYALPGGPPARPGLVRVAAGGAAIEVEVWRVPDAAFGGFVAGVPSPLAIGKLQLADGRQVCGFLCEPHAVSGAEDITAHGGWRRYLASRL
jgi:allophanate hydrolase